MEDIVVFPGLKVPISDNSFMFSYSRNAHVTFVENPQLKIIFEIRVIWNYAIRVTVPLKGLRV